MIYTFTRRLCALLGLAGLVLVGAAAGPAAGQGAPGRVRLYGHRTPTASLGRRVGRVPASQAIPLTLALAARDPQGLDALLGRLYDARDPLHGHFLTPAQFTARFSPTPAQCAAVADFARSQGLSVTGLTADRLLLHLSAPSGAVEAAFGVRLTQFLDADGRLFHAPDADPSVPATVAPLIAGVVGLDDSAILHTHLQPLAVDPLAPLDALLPEIGTGPGGGLRPSDIRAAYNLNSVSLTGAGQTLAVFELDGYLAGDIAGYESAYGLPQVPLQNVLVDKVDYTQPGGGQAEVTLDIELQAALAPGVSRILVYEGPNTDKGLLDTYSQIATDDKAQQISTSWGLSEGGIGPSLLNAESVIFKKMAAQGQSLFAAAGDSGAYDDGKTLSVDDPASQPYVTGVGGTSLTTASAGGPYGSETTWPNGGGGVSAFWPAPAWQQGVASPASLGSTSMRNVPDVALDADPSTGYSVFLNGGWAIYGGTSCASPLWAAFTALINQQRAAGGAGPLGFANPALYAIGSGQYGKALADFHDIADGSTNRYYPAVTGYDDATGWGTLNGAGLLADLTPPSAPAALSAAPGSAQVSLSWAAAPGASAYNLYRATTSGGEGGTPYRTGLTGTAYADMGLTNGTTYYYAVTATDPAGESTHSNEASAAPTAPAAPVNGAAFVSQSVPATMAAGQSYPVSVTLTNTGTTTWTGGAAYSLGSQSPQDSGTWGLGRVPLPGPVAPGQSATFRFTVTAPSAPGNYPFQWRMVQEFVQWFGDFTPAATVNVTQGGAQVAGNGAAFVSQSVPATMAAGQSYPVSVTLTNTGTTTWTDAGNYHLGSQSPQDGSAWGANRQFLPAGAAVAPGQSVTFSFTVTAPSAPGNYPFQWRMVQEFVQWFGDFTPAATVNVTQGGAQVAGNGAAFVSQSVPATMAAGQSYPVSVTLTNTGTTTWTDAGNYHLGSQSPQDGSAWGANRQFLPAGAAVAPGQSVTFSFTVTAPSAPGNYPFQWRMVQEFVQWFGEYTSTTTVSVS